MKFKGWMLGGLIGFLVPWLIFFYLYLTCSGSSCGDIGFALQPIFVISIILSLIGILFVLTFFKKNKITKIFVLLGLLIPWSFFILKWLEYTKLPSIEQRGQIGFLLFLVLIINIFTILGGYFVGFLIRNYLKK